MNLMQVVPNLVNEDEPLTLLAKEHSADILCRVRPNAQALSGPEFGTCIASHPRVGGFWMVWGPPVPPVNIGLRRRLKRDHALQNDAVNDAVAVLALPTSHLNQNAFTKATNDMRSPHSFAMRQPMASTPIGLGLEQKSRRCGSENILLCR